MNSSNPKLDKEARKQLSIDNHLANEKIHSLVVKIISWKTGLVEGASIQSDNKITQEEWDTYKKHTLKIPTSNQDKVKDKIKETYEAIKRNDGFKGS